MENLNWRLKRLKLSVGWLVGGTMDGLMVLKPDGKVYFVQSNKNEINIIPSKHPGNWL
jgi:hypothetical protein